MPHSSITKDPIKTHAVITPKIWKRISTWIAWSDLSISGDTLTLTIRFGDVGVALRAFRYYVTGSDPHGSRRPTGE